MPHLQVKRFGSEMAALDNELVTAQSSEGARPAAAQDEVGCACKVLGIELGQLEAVLYMRAWHATSPRGFNCRSHHHVPAMVSELDDGFSP